MYYQEANYFPKKEVNANYRIFQTRYVSPDFILYSGVTDQWIDANGDIQANGVYRAFIMSWNKEYTLDSLFDNPTTQQSVYLDTLVVD